MIKQNHRKRNGFPILLSDLVYQPLSNIVLEILRLNTKADDYYVGFNGFSQLECVTSRDFEILHLSNYRQLSSVGTIPYINYGFIK